jgi:hypothetical protein
MSSITIPQSNTANKKRKLVEIICVGCHLPFSVPEYKVAIGRKYCGRECLANDKGFHIKDIEKVV